MFDQCLLYALFATVCAAIFLPAMIQYSRHALLDLCTTLANTVTIDLAFLNDPVFHPLRPRKRGQRGGLRNRLRRRRYRLPLPTIIFGNAQSLNNKTDEFEACCNFLKEFREANIICLTETWLKDTQDDPHINNFSVYRRDRTEEATGKTRGGGVCVFVNSQWCTHVTVKEDLCHEDIELLTVALRPFYLPREFNQLFVTVIYVQPNANLKSASSILCNVINRLSASSPDAPSLILGDFNSLRLNRALPTFKQYVTCTTCGDNTIDLCWGNIKDAYKSRALPSLGRSVHNMVQLLPVYRQKVKRLKPTVRTIKVWSPESTAALNGCFECTDWDTLCPPDCSIDEVTDTVSSYIAFCVDHVLESKEIKIYSNTKPWITPELKKLLQERQAAFKEGDQPRVKQLQRRLEGKIRAEKRKYKEKLEDNLKKCDSRQYWKNIATITGYKQKSGALQADDEHTLAEELNTFYTRFDMHDFHLEQQQALARVKERTGDLINVNVTDVQKIFKGLNARSAAGPDGVTGKTLKLCSEALAPVFTHLFQRSFQEGHVPLLWRTSTIVPVPKKKNPSQLNDFRPVALTSIPMKCAERIALKRLQSETAQHQDPLQFAYCQGRNTEDAILTLLHHLYEHLEGPGTYARVLFVDFSSAFNTLQPHLLTEKLLEMDVNPSLIHWIHSFMTERPQQVRVGSTLSSVSVTNTGAPQGCVLSPALFTTYTAACRTADPCNVQIKFADDTSLTGLIKSDEVSYRSAVAELVDWCDRHYLQLNITKTEEMLIDFRRQPQDLEPLVIKGEAVRVVNSYKYLGTVIDDKLAWTANVDACCKKANQRLFFLRKLKQFKVSTPILSMFHQSVVESTLLYNQLCYYQGATAADRERMDRITTTAERLLGKEVRPLHQAYEVAAVKKIRRISQDETHPLHAVVSSCESKRHPGRYRSMRCRTSRFLNSFLPSAIRIATNTGPE